MTSSLTEQLRKLRRTSAALAAAIVLATGSAVVTVWALGQPTSARETTQLHYQSLMQLSYSAQPQPGSLYAASGPTTGEPLFLASLQGMTFTVRYHLASASQRRLGGSLTVQMVLDDQGLQLVLAPPQQVAIAPNGSARVTLPVAPSHYQAALTQLDTIGGPGSYPVAIDASASVTGALGGQPLRTLAHASFAFTGTTAALVPAFGGSGATSGGTQSTPASGSAPSDAGNGAQRVVPGTVPVTHRVPATIDVGRVHLAKMMVVLAAVVVALGAAMWAVAAKRHLARLWRDDPRLAVAIRMSGRSVAVLGSDHHGPAFVLPDEHAVTVGGADDLLRLSRILELPIVYAEEPGRTTFMVRDDRCVYCLRIPVATTGASVHPSAPLPPHPATVPRQLLAAQIPARPTVHRPREPVATEPER